MRHNADEHLRRLEREFRAAPSEDLRQRLSAEYLRLVPLTAEQLVFVIPEIMSGLNPAQRSTLLLGVMGACGENMSMELVKSAGRPLNWFPGHVGVDVCPRGHVRMPDDDGLFEVQWLDLRVSNVVLQHEENGAAVSVVDSPRLVDGDDRNPVLYCKYVPEIEVAGVESGFCGAKWPVGRLEYE